MPRLTCSSTPRPSKFAPTTSTAMHTQTAPCGSIIPLAFICTMTTTLVCSATSTTHPYHPPHIAFAQASAAAIPLSRPRHDHTSSHHPSRHIRCFPQQNGPRFATTTNPATTTTTPRQKPQRRRLRRRQTPLHQPTLPLTYPQQHQPQRIQLHPFLLKLHSLQPVCPRHKQTRS